MSSTAGACDTCQAPLRLWLRATHAAEEAVGNKLGAVAKQSAIHPCKCILLALFACFLCAVGFIRFEEENDGRYLWADQHSEPMKNLEYVEGNFEGNPRPNRIIITAKDGGNMLEVNKFLEAFQVQEDILALQADGQTYSSMFCLRVATGECMGNGILRYFNSSRAIFQSQVSSNEQLLAAINSPTFPDDGSKAFVADNMGGVVRDSAGRVVSAAAIRIDFLIEEDAAVDPLDWELEIQDRYVDDGTGRVKQTYENVNIYIMSGRSQDDELARTVGGDIPLFAGAFVIMSTFCSLLLGRACSWTQGRRLLGFLDFLLVLQGMLGGYGIAMLIGTPFTVLQQILPFILVGIGIDDAFVITNAFDATDASLPIPDRIELAMKRIGVSITLTSLTDIVAFLLGAMSAFPSVQYFCIYAAMSVLFIWLLHCTSYCAFLAMDARRAAANPPGLDPCCCCSARSACLPPEGATQGPAPGTKSALSRFLGQMTRILVCHPVTMILTVLFFFSLSAISLWQVGEGLGTEFELIDLTPDESYLRDFYNVEERHWGAYANLGIPLALYVRNVDFADVNIQRSMEEAGSSVLSMVWVNEEAGLASWHAEFSVWAWQNRDSNALLPSSAFEEVPGGAARSDCQAGLPSGMTECVTHFLTGPTFGAAVREFLALPQFGRFEDDVVFYHDGSIYAARTRAQHVDTYSSDQQVDALEEAEALADRYQGQLPGCFVFAQPYIYYDQFRIIVSQMATSVIACLVGVTIISAFVLAHPIAVFIVLITLGLVFMDLMGNILLWGLDLNSISMINLVMAVGLVVDYSMHVAHSFMLQDKNLPRTERAVKAMEEIGPAVFLGVSATFVSILPLALGSSQIFRVFFRMFFGIVIVGGLHGLVLMPVFMAICGPNLSDISPSPKVPTKVAALEAGA